MARKTGDHPAGKPDLRQRMGGQFLRLVNPITRRMIAAGLPTGAPNVLLTVRGRRSGVEHTTPVGLVVFEGRRFIQASYGEGGWVRNLRAADGEATITERDHAERVVAVELPASEGGDVLRRALESFHRSRMLRALLGPRFRPPIGVLWRYRVRVDDTLVEYVADARRHPVFELRPLNAAPR